MAQTTYTLTTFIEPDPEDAEVPDRYLVGFRDANGKSWGLIVPLDVDDVRRAVASEERKWTTVMYQIEGMAHAQPNDLDPADDHYGVLLEVGLLEHVAIDDLVEDSIETEYDEPDDETLPEAARAARAPHRHVRSTRILGDREPRQVLKGRSEHCCRVSIPPSWGSARIRGRRQPRSAHVHY
jgi:hypothetical protein